MYCLADNLHNGTFCHERMGTSKLKDSTHDEMLRERLSLAAIAIFRWIIFLTDAEFCVELARSFWMETIQFNYFGWNEFLDCLLLDESVKAHVFWGNERGRLSGVPASATFTTEWARLVLNIQLFQEISSIWRDISAIIWGSRTSLENPTSDWEGFIDTFPVTLFGDDSYRSAGITLPYRVNNESNKIRKTKNEKKCWK